MCWRVHYFLFLVLIATANAGRKYSFDYTYDEKVGGWLKLHRMPATFQDAFFRCNLEGAVLASPTNENLYEAMVSKMAASNIDCAIFTGIHATISKGDFTSIEGIPLERIPLIWASGEPDNYENKEDCIIMMQKDGAVADVQCNETYPYICYKNMTKNIEVNACGTVDSEYKLDERTGSCYKFHRNTETWRRAQSTCIAEGGHLAIINSAAEVQVLRDLFDKYPASSIKAEHPDNVALGFLDLDQKGSWFTVHGQSLDVAEYNSWSSGQPSAPGSEFGGQYCGSMFRTGLLDNYWCDSKHLVFICEKSPLLR